MTGDDNNGKPQGLPFFCRVVCMLQALSSSAMDEGAGMTP